MPNPAIEPDRTHPAQVTSADRASLVRSFTAWCGDPVTAEDLTQETLLEAWKSDRTPDDPAEWTPWLFGIARFADRILVMAHGCIVESGTHHDLIRAGGNYAAMWATQSSWYT